MSNDCGNTAGDNEFQLGCTVDEIGNTSTGANILSSLYLLESNGSLGNQSANQIISTVVAAGFVQAFRQCPAALAVEQKLSLSCPDSNLFSQTVTKKTSNCQRCLLSVKEILSQRDILDRSAHEANPNYIVPTPSVQLKAKINGVLPSQFDGACRYVCQQCLVESLNQSVSAHMTTECEVGDQAFRTAFTSGMANQAYESLLGNANSLSDIYQAKTDKDIAGLSIQVANTISQMTSVKSLNQLKSFALALQSTTIEPGSTSVVLTNINQTIDIQVFASMVSTLYTDARIQNAIKYQQQLSYIKLQQDFNSLVASLETQVIQIQGLLESTIGKLIIALGAVVITGVIVLIMWAFLKRSGGIITPDMFQ